MCKSHITRYEHRLLIVIHSLYTSLRDRLSLEPVFIGVLLTNRATIDSWGTKVAFNRWRHNQWKPYARMFDGEWLVEKERSSLCWSVQCSSGCCDNCSQGRYVQNWRSLRCLDQHRNLRRLVDRQPICMPGAYKRHSSNERSDVICLCGCCSNVEDPLYGLCIRLRRMKFSWLLGMGQTSDRQERLEWGDTSDNNQSI